MGLKQKVNFRNVDITKLKGFQQGLGKPKLGWHVSIKYKNDKYPHLRYGDERYIIPGKVLKANTYNHNKPELCIQGMHASPIITGALSYLIFDYSLEKLYLSRVAVYKVNPKEIERLWDRTLPGGPKFVGLYREALFLMNVQKLLSNTFDYDDIDGTKVLTRLDIMLARNARILSSINNKLIEDSVNHQLNLRSNKKPYWMK